MYERNINPDNDYGEVQSVCTNPHGKERPGVIAFYPRDGIPVWCPIPVQDLDGDEYDRRE
jgi:hypothetical protein